MWCGCDAATICASSSLIEKSERKFTIPSHCICKSVLFIWDIARVICPSRSERHRKSWLSRCSPNSPKPSSSGWWRASPSFIPKSFPPCRFRWLLSWREYAPHNRRIQLVLAVVNIAAVVFHVQHKYGEHPLLVEVFLSDCHGKDAVQSVFSISRLITMPPHVPCKDADLIEIERHAVFGFG